MKTILLPEGLAAEICGKQKPLANRPCRFSDHCVFVPCDDGVLLYQTMTGTLLLWEKADVCLDGNADFKSQLLDAACADENRKQLLVENWFLVPEEFDEYRFVKDVRSIMRLLRKEKPYKHKFTIFTTTDCNARCFYCYEMGIKRTAMTVQTAHDVAEYIALSCKGHKVRLSWFGGEPLYNIPVIDVITEDLMRRGIEFDSIMTSNGFFLDEAIAKKAKEKWKVTRVQITLDGTRAVYNKTKAYVNIKDDDKDPYDRVMDNIQHAIDAGLGVTIRLNMDSSNADNLMDLCDEIYARFGNRDGVECAPTLLREWAGPIHQFVSDDEKLALFIRLREKLASYGLIKASPIYRDMPVNHCMADNDAAETIMPDGSIGKCDQYQGKDLIGSIYEEHRDTELLRAWKEPIEFPECNKCALFPGCYNLKKCNWYKDGCSELMRTLHMGRLRRQILNAYDAQCHCNTLQ